MEEQLYIVFPAHSFSQSPCWCYRLTPKSGVNLHTLLISQLVKQIPAFHGTFKVSYHGHETGVDAGDDFAFRAKSFRVESRRVKK